MALNKKPKTSTTTNTNAASPYVGGALEDLNSVYNDTANGKQITPMNSDMQAGLNLTRGLSRQPVPGLAQAQQFNTGLLANGGMTDDLRTAQGYLTPFANGSMQEDPRLQAQLDINANRAANGAATRFGGGRYGSAAIGNGVGTAVSEANNGIMLQSNENSRNRQLQASGLLGSMGESARASAQQSSSMLPMLDNLRYAGAERQAGIGDFRNEWSMNPNAWNVMGKYGQNLGLLGGNSTTTVAPKSGSSAQSAIGGAIAGATAGNKLLPGGWGTAVGGLLGGAGGYFS